MLERQRQILKFIVFSSLGRSRIVERSIAKSDICVGRSDPTNPDRIPDLDLMPDLQVSRRQARVWKVQEKWFIEDLGSKHGTLVEGSEIKGCGAVEFIPGTPVMTGDTIWTIIPDDWLFVRWQDVIIFAPCVKEINYALYHCGTPVLGTVTTRNFSQRKSTPLHIRLQVEGYSDPCHVSVPAIDPDGHVSLEAPIIRLHAALLKSQPGTVQAQLMVEVNRSANPKATKEITILGFWSWSYDKRARKTIAAFVSPRNPVIEQRIVPQAHANMKVQTGTISFNELVRSGRADGEGLVLEALYEYMKDNCYLIWCPPDSRGHYQHIKPPHRIFSSNLPKPKGEGTCIDLALLMASCLENAGLCPVVVLIGRQDGVPDHAFAGCWAGAVPGSRPIIYNRQYLQREVEIENLFIVECTGFAKKRGGREGEKLDFNKAVESAIGQLDNEDEWPWICAIDINALRQEPEPISPMDLRYEPVVERAYREAELLAGRKENTVMTAFLLYGCIVAKGEVVHWLFQKAGIDPLNIYENIDRLTKTGSVTGKLSYTGICTDCKRWAEEVSWKAGSHSVREQDLLWAIFARGKESASLRRICEHLRIDLDMLHTFLSERYPCPEMPVSFGSFASGMQE